MTIISKLKRLLGLESTHRDQTSTAVPVEPEPPAETERAVKESTPEPDTPRRPEPEPVTEPAAEPDSGRNLEPDSTPEPEPPSAATDEPSIAGEVSEPQTPVVSGDPDAPVQTISGIGPAYAERLAEAGIESVEDLAAADPAELGAETGLGEGRVADWITRARGE